MVMRCSPALPISRNCIANREMIRMGPSAVPMKYARLLTISRNSRRITGAILDMRHYLLADELLLWCAHALDEHLLQRGFGDGKALEADARTDQGLQQWLRIRV